jgi:response regulator NasT
MSEEAPSRLRIALAEDDRALRGLFVRYLQQLGHEVVCAAADGGELLRDCRQQQVDLAIVDLDMPVVDGLTAAEEIAVRGIPVVLVSGHPDLDEVVLEHEPVASRISKPASLESFRRAIAEALATG